MGPRLALVSCSAAGSAGARDSVLAERNTGGDPRADRRRRGARDGARARPLPPRPRLAGIRRGRRAREEGSSRPGLSDAAIERFPADGTTRYAHFRSYYGWNPVRRRSRRSRRGRVRSRVSRPSGRARRLQPGRRRDGGAGGRRRGHRPEDYAGKDVTARIVLASGPLPLVHRLRLRGARRRRLPLRLPQPDDGLVGRRPRPRALGPSVAVPDRRTASPSCSRSGRPTSFARGSREARRSLLRARVAREDGPGHLRRRRPPRSPGRIPPPARSC